MYKWLQLLRGARTENENALSENALSLASRILDQYDKLVEKHAELRSAEVGRESRTLYEYHKLVEKHAELRAEVGRKEVILEYEAEELLIARNQLSIRGGLELAVERLSHNPRLVPRNVTGVTGVLAHLITVKDWKVRAEKFALVEGGVRMSDVERCQKHLYHTYSKIYHGNIQGLNVKHILEIPERVAVRATLDLANIPYNF